MTLIATVIKILKFNFYYFVLDIHTVCEGLNNMVFLSVKLNFLPIKEFNFDKS